MKEKLKKQPTKSKKKIVKSKVKNWYANRYQLVLVQRNILLIFALFSSIAVSFGMVFLNHIISSKSLEPYVIEIEEKTGIPTIVDQKTVEEYTGNELMQKYFINKFIDVSTAYNPRTYPSDVEEVRVFSSASVYGDFRSRIKARVLGTDTLITIGIKSIQFPNKNTAFIRVLETTTKGVAKEKTTKDKLITLNFTFDPKIKLNNKERLLNPLGFQIINYSIVEEISK
jgi:type IV secretion system protein VirB8